MDCLVRGPANVQGGAREIYSPRYSALWGGLKIASTYSKYNSPPKIVWYRNAVNSLSKMIENCPKAMKQFVKSLRF